MGILKKIVGLYLLFYACYAPYYFMWSGNPSARAKKVTLIDVVNLETRLVGESKEERESREAAIQGLAYLLREQGDVDMERTVHNAMKDVVGDFAMEELPSPIEQTVWVRFTGQLQDDEEMELVFLMTKPSFLDRPINQVLQFAVHKPDIDVTRTVRSYRLDGMSLESLKVAALCYDIKPRAVEQILHFFRKAHPGL